MKNKLHDNHSHPTATTSIKHAPLPGKALQIPSRIPEMKERAHIKKTNSDPKNEKNKKEDNTELQKKFMAKLNDLKSREKS